MDSPIEHGHKAYSITFADSRMQVSGNAIVIAVDLVHAAEKAEEYVRRNEKSMHLVKVEIENDTVVE